MTTQPLAEPGSAFRQRAATAGLAMDGQLRYGPFALTLDRYELLADGVPLELSPLRLELLAIFFAAPERVWSRRELDELAGGGAADDGHADAGQVESRRIDVRLARLRVALGADIFRTVTGRGWILRPVHQITPRRGPAAG